MDPTPRRHLGKTLSVSVLPHRFPFAATPAAFAAAVCVMAALAADAGHGAPAQVGLEAVHLEAEYPATLAGLPIGHGTWAIDIADDQYTAAASGATSGL